MINPHRATREVNALLDETGLIAATGRVFSRLWDAPGEIRTVIYMVNAARREDVIDALQERFDDITKIYRFDRDDSRATYCAVGIHRRKP